MCKFLSFSLQFCVAVSSCLHVISYLLSPLLCVCRRIFGQFAAWFRGCLLWRRGQVLWQIRRYINFAFILPLYCLYTAFILHLLYINVSLCTWVLKCRGRFVRPRKINTRIIHPTEPHHHEHNPKNFLFFSPHRWSDVRCRHLLPPQRRPFRRNVLREQAGWAGIFLRAWHLYQQFHRYVLVVFGSCRL